MAGRGFRLTEPYNRVLSLLLPALGEALCCSRVVAPATLTVLEHLITYRLLVLWAIFLPSASAHVVFAADVTTTPLQTWF